MDLGNDFADGFFAEGTGGEGRGTQGTAEREGAATDGAVAVAEFVFVQRHGGVSSGEFRMSSGEFWSFECGGWGG